MKIFKKLIISITIIMMILFSLIPPKMIYANDYATSKEVGEAIVSVAMNFMNTYGPYVAYDAYQASDGSFPSREKAYKNQFLKSVNAYNAHGDFRGTYENVYAMDCVGFVSIIMHQATNLGGSSFTYFGIPRDASSSYKGTGISIYSPKTSPDNNYYLELVTDGTKRAGDIICWKGHVGIVVNSTTVVHCFTDKIQTSSISDVCGWSAISDYEYKIIRIRNGVIKKSNLKYFWDRNKAFEATHPEVDWDKVCDESQEFHIPQDGEEIPDESDTYILYNPNGFGEIENGIFYNGIPLSGAYLGSINTSDLVLNWLGDIFDWLIGIVTLGYKIQFIGWSTIIQNIAKNIVNTISGDSNITLNAEKILFNQVPILDVNFFNTETAGGVEINSTNVEYMLKQNVASLYVTIRYIVIIVMLVILLYVGIRVAIASIAQDKAKYRKMLVGWVVGFVVVMFIHYFMIVVMYSNETIINLIGNQESIGDVMYDEARAYAYEIPASKGWTGTIVYVFLVYYLIKLLIFYFKRLIVVYILAIVSPIMGAAYAIEMIKGKSRSLTTWMKEFSFNVIIQSIHILIYSVFMNIIYNLMKTASITQILGIAVIMVLVLNLMLRSEKLIKKIFGLKSNSMKDVMDSVVQASQSLATAAVIGKIGTSAAKRQIVKQYSKSVDRKVDKKYAQFENDIKLVKQSELASDIQREIEKLKKAEKNQIKEYDSNAVKYAKDMFTRGIGGVIRSVPMMFEGGPIMGTASMIDAGFAINEPPRGIDGFSVDDEKLNALIQKYGIDPEGYMIPKDEYVKQMANDFPFHYMSEYDFIFDKDKNKEELGNEEHPEFENGRYYEESASDDKDIDKTGIGAGTEPEIESTSGEGQRENTEGIDGPVDPYKYIEGNAGENTEGGIGENTERRNLPKGENSRQIATNGKNKALERKNKKEARKLARAESNKPKRYTGRKIGGVALHLATAGASTRAARVIGVGRAGLNAIRDESNTKRIYVLYELQKRVLEEEGKLNASVEKLKQRGYPPVFYSGKSTDDPMTVLMNEKLREKYSQELELNLRQAAAGQPSVDRSDVAESLGSYSLRNGNMPKNLDDIREVVNEIAENNDYEVGDNFEENIKISITNELMKKLEQESDDANAQRIREEFINKVTAAIENNNWDEATTEKEIQSLLNNELTNEVISTLSAEEITDILDIAMNRAGTLTNKDVAPEFEEIVDSVAKISEMNKDMSEISESEKPILNTEKIIDNILNNNAINGEIGD